MAKKTSSSFDPDGPYHAASQWLASYSPDCRSRALVANADPPPVTKVLILSAHSDEAYIVEASTPERGAI
jgi:DNA-binding NarL/FixJ family response regulator